MEKREPGKERNSGYISLGKSIKLGTHVAPRRREETIRGDQIEHERYRCTIARYFVRARASIDLSLQSRTRDRSPRVTFYSRHLLAYDRFITACCLSQNPAKRFEGNVQTSDQVNTAIAEKCMSQSRFPPARLWFFPPRGPELFWTEHVASRTRKFDKF